MSLGNKETMAKNIKRLMALNQVNATDVCTALGFKAPTFSDWVNAKTYPRIDKIEAMSNYFGVSKADLVEEQLQSNCKKFIVSFYYFSQFIVREFSYYSGKQRTFCVFSKPYDST